MRPFHEGGLRYVNQPYPWIHLVFVAMAVVFWGVVIYGLVLFINKYAKEHAGKDSQDALSIAKKRYASGEISKEEFDKLKKDLA